MSNMRNIQNLINELKINRLIRIINSTTAKQFRLYDKRNERLSYFILVSPRIYTALVEKKRDKKRNARARRDYLTDSCYNVRASLFGSVTALTLQYMYTV